MNTHMLIEAFGYLGSILVVISMLMTSVMKLRIINTTGSVIFATYAFIIHSYPTAFMNVALVLINLYNMKRLSKNSKHYHLMEGTPTDSFTKFFLDEHHADIHEYFPRFTGVEADQTVLVTFCDDTPAGILVGTQYGDAMDITLDYTTPVYRDCSAGEYLFNTLKARGIKTLRCSRGAQEHKDYLSKMGFVNENGLLIKQL